MDFNKFSAFSNGSFDLHTTISDPYNKANNELNKASNLFHNLTTGVIIDVSPMLHSYVVFCGGNIGRVVCCTLQATGSAVYFSVDGSSYSAGTYVLVALPYKHETGIILGAINIPRGVNNILPRYFLDNGTRLLPDPSDRSVLISAEPRDEVPDFGFNKNLDMVDIGEFCRRSIGGTEIFLDPFMTLMAANDYTGLWLFAQDALTRLSGVNLQISASGYESERLNDNGEYIEYSGSSLYPWENIGYYSTEPYELIEDNPRETWQNINTTGAYCDPGEANAKPFHRSVTYGGWLGQGTQHYSIIPPQTGEWYLFGSQSKPYGGSKISQNVDGTVSIEASKGLLLTKRGMFPVPERKNRPDEPKSKVGDNEYNYDSEEFLLPKDLTHNDTNRGMESAVGVSDFIGYTLNWKTLFPFAYHKEDYYIQEESELPNSSLKKPNFSYLSSEQFITDDAPYTMNIDKKRMNQDYYTKESGIALLPEGGVVIYDGYGSEIRMANGSISISAPGDISIKPGRSTNIWSGKDTSIRSNKGIDISSTTESVRIKAEKYMEVLGANGGTGGVIIESKGSGSFNFDKSGDDIQTAGVLIKATNGTVASIGDQIYMRSGYESTGSGIYLDAQKGKDTIYVICKDKIEYISTTSTIHFGLLGSKIEKTTQFSKDKTLLAGKTIMEGPVASGKSITVKGNVNVTGLFNSTKQKETNQSLVGDIKSQEQTLIESVDTLVKPIKEELPKEGEQLYKDSIKPQIYEEDRIGYTSVLTGSGFSFRTTEQYTVPQGYLVYEDRWQHISSDAKTWSEKGVEVKAGTTYPFPGEQYFEGGLPCYVSQEDTIVDFNNGYYKDRMEGDKPASCYSEPKFGKQNKKSLQEYKIV